MRSTKQEELKQVKGQVRTEELKSSLVNTATNISDKVGSLFNKSKVKSLEEQNSELQGQVNDLQGYIKIQQSEHDKEIANLRNDLRKIYNLVPNVEDILKIEQMCRSSNINIGTIKELVKGNTFTISGNLYSEMYKRNFHVENLKINFNYVLMIWKYPSGSIRNTGKH